MQGLSLHKVTSVLKEEATVQFGYAYFIYKLC